MNERIKQQLIVLSMGVILLLLVMRVDTGKSKGKAADARAGQETETVSTGQKKKQEEKQEEKGTESTPETQKAAEQAEVKNVENPNIRVLICSDQYQGNYHQRVVLECSTSYRVKYGDTVEEHSAAEQVTIEPGDPWLASGPVTLEPTEENGIFRMPELKRSYESPEYAGSFEVEQRAEGLLVINELPLETYLCSVVPSEMPSSYPEEALKAQAVCARTYARQQMAGERGAEYGADVDDSVSYQVYNNIAKNEQTTQAVQETAGMTMKEGEELVSAWYYSTSCGIDLSTDLSEEAVFCAFMEGDSSKAYEKDEPWYRWKASYTLEELTRLASLRSAEAGQVTEMQVADRESNGAVKTLVLKGTAGSLEAQGEYDVRKLLQTDHAGLTLQDGSEGPNLGMLPSAFFYLTPVYEGEILTGYQLTGGGYGHGKGMSQNGARHMAEAGKSCKEILKYYYGDIQIR